MAAELKKTFQELSSALKDLHRDLLMLEAKSLEADTGRKITPYELLHASLHDPNMAWLRQMSALIVNIDTVIDETTNLSAQEANQISTAVLALLEPPGPQDSDFWTKYSNYLSSNPDIIMKHSKVKSLTGDMRPKM
ncbi:MAG: hypothetical protein KF799_03290 [Bdellovibrionales bacterium]|nr:hypothetical protein [Bdellovibrionales bacterium]